MIGRRFRLAHGRIGKDATFANRLHRSLEPDKPAKAPKGDKPAKPDAAERPTKTAKVEATASAGASGTPSSSPASPPAGGPFAAGLKRLFGVKDE